MPLYFAYGSNLDWEQMRERCPSARFVCVAMLKDHRFAISRYSTGRKCGVASAIADDGHDVWGVAYDIDDRDWGGLDVCEGFRPGRPEGENAYVRRERHVFDGGDEKRPLRVLIYLANPEPNPPPPSRCYMHQIIMGAKQWRLPEGYVAALEQVEVER